MESVRIDNDDLLYHNDVFLEKNNKCTGLYYRFEENCLAFLEIMTTKK